MWWYLYNPYLIYPYYIPLPYDMMYLLLATFYWWFYIEAFKIILEMWKKTCTLKEITKKLSRYLKNYA